MEECSLMAIDLIQERWFEARAEQLLARAKAASSSDEAEAYLRMAAGYAALAAESRLRAEELSESTWSRVGKGGIHKDPPDHEVSRWDEEQRDWN